MHTIEIGDTTYIIDVETGEMIDKADPPNVMELTCKNCSDVRKCRFAFDPYNIHGDCIMEK
jgi:hypothetical protein